MKAERYVLKQNIKAEDCEKTTYVEIEGIVYEETRRYAYVDDVPKRTEVLERFKDMMKKNSFREIKYGRHPSWDPWRYVRVDDRDGSGRMNIDMYLEGDRYQQAVLFDIHGMAHQVMEFLDANELGKKGFYSKYEEIGKEDQKKLERRLKMLKSIRKQPKGIAYTCR